MSLASPVASRGKTGRHAERSPSPIPDRTAALTTRAIASDISYALPLLSRLLATLPLPLALHTPTHRTIRGSLYPLGALSIPLNAIGLFYLLFCSITFNFPGYYPVDSGNMNYTCAAVGAIMGVSAVTWACTARRRFRGPVSGGVVVGGGGVEEREAGSDDVVGEVEGESGGKEGKGM